MRLGFVLALLMTVGCATDADGTLVVGAGTDLVLWTPAVEARAGEIRAAAGPDKILFITDGQVSPKAVEGLGKAGVSVRALALGPVR